MEVLVGNILSAGLGQNVARQVAIHAGIPETTPAMAINKALRIWPPYGHNGSAIHCPW